MQSWTFFLQMNHRINRVAVGEARDQWRVHRDKQMQPLSCLTLFDRYYWLWPFLGNLTGRRLQSDKDASCDQWSLKEYKVRGCQGTSDSWNNGLSIIVFIIAAVMVKRYGIFIGRFTSSWLFLAVQDGWLKATIMLLLYCESVVLASRCVCETLSYPLSYILSID